MASHCSSIFFLLWFKDKCNRHQNGTHTFSLLAEAWKQLLLHFKANHHIEISDEVVMNWLDDCHRSHFHRRYRRVGVRGFLEGIPKALGISSAIGVSFVC